MSSSPETSTRTAGAHRAHREARDRAAARALAGHPPAGYEPHLDGLFTYCMSVLCDHEAATAALGEALACAERRAQRGPERAPERRAWLYALARWACLRRLAAARQQRQAAHAAGRPGDHRRRPDRTGAPVPVDVQEARRRELSLLAWPEAAGTTPEQREALELAVRHRLTGHEVAAVLGMSLAAARDLLASAACEVERTRAALAVVEAGGCPGVAVLAGPDGFVLSTALRRELVRHVDDCPRCRRTAERAVPGRWPGASVTPAQLPVLTAPRTALRVAMAHPPRARSAVPRFDRRGFPMDPKDRAARRDRLRARAVTTTVVATVVAAPVLALWAAYRGTPTGEGRGGPSATAREASDPAALAGAVPGGGYVNTADTGPGPGGGPRASGRPEVSVSVTGADGAAHEDGRLSVAAASAGDTTLVTLTASGPAAVHWSAATAAPWLHLSRSSGTLKPGETVAVRIYVDHLREPSGHWSARVTIAPARTVITIDGHGAAPFPSATPAGPKPSGDPRPTPTATATPNPSQPPPTTSATPTPSPTAPSPTTSADPSPSPPENTGAPSPSTS
ncbi:BACON domain-containing protein [Streptomyces seoulensis]